MEEDESKMTPQFLAWMTRQLFVSLLGKKNRQRNRASLEEENGFGVGHVDAQVFMESVEIQVSSVGWRCISGSFNLKIVSRAMGVDKITQQSEKGNEKKPAKCRP